MKKQQNLKNGKVRFRLNIDVRKKMEDLGLNAIECLKLITFVKGRMNFSCKSTTAAIFDLMEFLLDNWLKNNHITVDKIYYLRSLFVFFTNFSFQIYCSTAENQYKNRILWQLAKITLEWISQSNGSIGCPLGFVIDRLNTSASLYRIAPCLKCQFFLEIIYSCFFKHFFVAKNDIFCTLWMAHLNQFCDNLHWAWRKLIFC